MKKLVALVLSVYDVVAFMCKKFKTDSGITEVIDIGRNDKIKVRIELVANDTSRKVDVEVAKGRTIRSAVIENVEVCKTGANGGVICTVDGVKSEFERFKLYFALGDKITYLHHGTAEIKCQEQTGKNG